MRRFLSFLVAERTVMTVILVNTVAVFAQGRDLVLPEHGNPWFWVDYGCVAFFLVEAAIKIRRAGFRGYLANGWNRFDFAVLLLSLPLLASPWLRLEQFAAVPVLRVGRLFRLFRLLRFIPNRDHLVDGVQRALRASIGVFLALLLVNVILGVGATLLFGELAPEHFGNPMAACYTIFKVITIEGWYDVPDLLATRSGHPGWAVAARLYFVLTVVVGGLLGLSIANAVFVDEMMMDNNDEIEAKLDEVVAELRALRQEVERRG